MERQQPQLECPIRSVRNLENWMVKESGEGFFGSSFMMEDDGDLKFLAIYDQPRVVDGKLVLKPSALMYHGNLNPKDDLAAVHRLYNRRVGELGSYWDANTRVEWPHANINMSDVLDLYTDKDGTLQVPRRNCLKLAVDAYMNSPKVRFQPKRVRKFIAKYGMEELENME